jgi:hypothetical protein
VSTGGISRLLIRVDEQTADEYRAELNADREADLAAGSPDAMSLAEIEQEVASREDSLDLIFRFAVEMDDGRRIEDVWERGSNFAFMSTVAEDDPRPRPEDVNETFEWFRADLVNLDDDELLEVAASLREHDVEVLLADLANAPRELELTERAAHAIREAIARDLRLDAELGE